MSRRNKGGEGAEGAQIKTKSQLEFEDGIDDKPVITDVK